MKHSEIGLRAGHPAVAAWLAACLAAAMVTAGCSAQSTRFTERPSPSSSVVNTQPGPASPERLRALDVERMFADFAASESLAQSDTADDAEASDPADGYFADPEYAAAVLEHTSLSDPSSAGIRPLSSSAKHQLLIEAVARWRRIASKSGTEAANAAVDDAGLGGEQGDPPPTRDEEVLAVLGMGWEASEFMLRPPSGGDRSSWSWKVESITTEGTSTAHVVYSAKTDPKTSWSFKNPSMRYERIWRFSWNPGLRRWQVCDWPNQVEFLTRMQSNISDPKNELLMKDGQPFYWCVE